MAENVFHRMPLQAFTAKLVCRSAAQGIDAMGLPGQVGSTRCGAQQVEGSQPPTESLPLFDPTAALDPNRKWNAMLGDVTEAYALNSRPTHTSGDRTDSLPGSTIRVFSDTGLGEQSTPRHGFEVRKWIETRPLEAGIPDEHVAFMRDYKKHAHREKLFLDLREGRIEKHGNQNEEVEIRAYAPKGNYDSTLWGMTKDRVQSIHVVPEVDGKGIVINREAPDGNIQGITIAAPFEIGGRDPIVAVLMLRAPSVHWFYFHSVSVREQLRRPSSTVAQPEAGQERKALSAGASASVLKRISRVKEEGAAPLHLDEFKEVLFRGALAKLIRWMIERGVPQLHDLAPISKWCWATSDGRDRHHRDHKRRRAA